MGKLKNVLLSADQKLDRIGEQLKDKEVTLPTELLGAGIFLIFSIIMFAVMPSQVIVSETDVVNGRVFPRLLLMIMILCSLSLLASGLVKKARKEPLAVCTFHLLTELKALVILAILFFTYLICKWTDLFVAGSCFCALAFLLYFRCRKWTYYVITIGLAVVIWAAFRFGLGVRF